MAKSKSETLSPVLYLPHGGGPLPVLGDAGHGKLIEFLKEIGVKLGTPSAILVVSAHWEEDQATITSGDHPELIYDYYGFPPEAYRIQYPVPGHPQLAKTIFELLADGGIRARLDERRGFDHGLFIPLKLIYPDAQIPSIQLSLLAGLSPEEHIALGKALAALREKDVLIIGSGLSFHNLEAFFAADGAGKNESEEFHNWLIETCTSDEIPYLERERRLANWHQAPYARYCHPREEHLLPLHFCYGIACNDTPIAQVVFNQETMGRRVAAFLWH
jgi:aromatic ring-opening dioxygenase catalytic subunit (LigB family)